MPCILNCLVPFVSKRLDKWLLPRANRAKVWGQSNTSTGSWKVLLLNLGYDDASDQQEIVTKDRPVPLSAPRELGAGQMTEEGFVTSKAH